VTKHYLSQHNISKRTWLELSVEKLRGKRTKLWAVKWAKDIGNFCMQGNEKIG